MGAMVTGLIIGAIVFFLLELVIPSGGILSICSFACVVASVYYLFEISHTAGMIGIFAALITVPVAIVIGFKLLPHTPLGRRIVLRGTNKENGIIYDEARDVNPQQLVGTEGIALTDLRPVGTCRVDDKRLECISACGVISQGSRIRITSVAGIEIKVVAI